MPFKCLKAGGIEILIVAANGSIAGRLWKFLAGLARALRPGKGGSCLSAAAASPWQGSNTPAETADPPSSSDRRLEERVVGIDWYHTIDLGNGVVTPGGFDHAPSLHHYQLPERLDGVRVLDVATYDGFWAFEFERRGAREVIALDLERVSDLDLPPARRRALSPEELGRRIGEGFELAREALGSKVRRQSLSVYDLSPECFGTFDLVFVGSLLLHLTNPILALQRIASVTAGYALIVECYHPMVPNGFARYEGGVDNVWWFLSLGCVERMIRDAGFGRVERFATFGLIERGDARPRWHAGFRAYP